MALFRSIGLSALAGLLAGVAAWIFLSSLALATAYRQAHPWLIWLLPLGGLAIGWVYHFYGREAARGHNLILDEIHEPRATVPLRMAPLVLLGTLTTHLFGGSAGREGTAVQMGATLADQVAGFFRSPPAERKRLLMAGVGAGFGAAIGAPWAGAVFGLEVIFTGKITSEAWLECIVASFVGYGLTVLLRAPHTHFPAVAAVPWMAFPLVALAGVCFGALTRAFVMFTHLLERGFARIPVPPLRPFVGGALLAGLLVAEGTGRFAGLGLEIIQASFFSAHSWLLPFAKLFFTALTLAAGFKGGEFIPLVFMGATLGSALSGVLALAPATLAALGCAAVFGAAANTPLACTVMAMELFGVEIGPAALLACYLAFLVSGEHGIYARQRKEPSLLRRWLSRVV